MAVMCEMSAGVGLGLMNKNAWWGEQGLEPTPLLSGWPIQKKKMSI